MLLACLHMCIGKGDHEQYTKYMHLWHTHRSRHGHTSAPWPHLAEAALAQHHQEVKVSQLHAILVAIGVEPGSVGRLALCVLAWTDFSPLDERERKQGTALDTTSNIQRDHRL